MTDNTHMVHRLRDGDREIILVGTAHVSCPGKAFGWSRR